MYESLVDPPAETSVSSSFQKVEQDGYRATFRHAPVGIAHVDLAGRWLVLNQKFIEICGRTYDELMSLTFQEITHPEDLEMDLRLVERLLAGEFQNYSLEKRYLRGDGSIVWVNLTAALVRDESGRPIFFISVIEDISRRKDAEIALQRIQTRLEETVAQRTRELTIANEELRCRISEADRLKRELDHLFRLAPGVIAIFDGEFFRRVNPAFCELLGYSETELTTIPARTFLHPDDTVIAEDARTVLSRGEVLRNFENRFIARDGSVRWLSWNAVNVAELGLMYCIALDVTHAKETEALVADQKTQMAATSKMNALGRMAAGIAHEINNPLTSVAGQAFLMRQAAARDSLDREKVRVGAEKMEEMIQRIVGIINGLRAFGRDGSADSFQLTEIESIVDETLALCRGQMKAAGLRLEFIRPEVPTTVSCRAVQISQVLLNVVNNAHDAILGQREDLARSGRIEIRVDLAAEYVDLCVLDNGPGLDESAKANLFQPFFTTKPVGKGTGLGLSIARGIMDVHRGDIFVRTEEDGRTCFVIRLPRVKG